MGDLDAARIRSLLDGRWGRSLKVLESTESTMDDASKAAQRGVEDGHVVLADRQTRGRGAHGRQWVSPPGSDLYFSIVARPAIDPRSSALVTLATGLGVRDAVAELLPASAVAVKWPNDIWIEDRKCAGILVETRVVGARLEALIIGVGLNVNRTSWPAELEGLASSLRSQRTGKAAFDRGEVFAKVLSHIEQQVTRLVREGPSSLVRALRPHLALVGEPVRWEGGHGVFEGIDKQGAARVRTDSQVVTLHAARFERAGTGA